jgi:hypothetical protein
MGKIGEMRSGCQTEVALGRLDPVKKWGIQKTHPAPSTVSEGSLANISRIQVDLGYGK